METFSFGQKQPIHIAIRQLIHDYPQDEGILKELIQNADDGGASEIRFILDRRVNDKLSGPLSEWSDFASEALIVTNDRAFSDADLENIQHISDSDKISRPGQTGRYGRGFNAVYNLTDTPLLLTGSKLLLFDPCRFHVEKGESGKGWRLNDKNWTELFPDALSIFEGTGYKIGSSEHQGSIFRFPLRQKLKGNDKKDRITDQKFTPDTFSKLVDGLEKLAEQILLYLRNIKFIGCYEISADGKTFTTLLEIVTNNPEEVDTGRDFVNSLVSQCGNINELIEKIAGMEDDRHESIFHHDVSVKCNDRNDQLSWLVCSGVYAGKAGELIDCATKLNEMGNKAVPFAGAAICLEKNGHTLPEIEGRVSCFLPLSGVLGSTKIGFGINGAFDLDGSRTAVTKEKEGSYGATRLRAKWNELLVTHAISSAIARVVDSTDVSDVNTMRILYRLFPSVKAPFLKPFDNLVGSFLKQIANISFFRIANGTRVKLKDIRLIEDDSDLHEALCLECLPIPEPRLPAVLISSFKSLGIEISELSLKELREAFVCTNEVECLPAEFEKKSLHTLERIAAVARFFAKKQCDDFKMLPLALCCDGYLRTFPPQGKMELFIGTERQRRIFDRFPEWFLDPKLVENSGIRNLAADGFAIMDLKDVLTEIHKVLTDSRTKKSRWNPNGNASPNIGWLRDVFEELFAVPNFAEEDDGRELLQKTTLIPAEDLQLYPPGLTSTPLLVANSEASLVDILDSLGVNYFLLAPNNPLSRLITDFRNKIGLLWYLTPCDLIDSIGSRLHELPSQAEIWKNEKAVARLIAFLTNANLDEDESQKNERKKILRSLPIWKDVAGTIGGLNEKCYLQGQFTAPKLKNSARIMEAGDQSVLLPKLDVTQISRWELLSKHYLPSIATFSADNLYILTVWLRDEWSNLAKEHEQGSDGLLATICQLPILLDEDERATRPHDLYLKNAADFATEVLGKNVRCPSPSRYSEHPDLWNDFFTRLGVLTSPSAQHLVNFIQQLMQAYQGKLPNEVTEKRLLKVLGHVRDHWVNLRDDEVVTQDHEQCPFHKFISETRCIPAYRGEDAANQFGAWKEPAARLFRPCELVPFSLGKSVASVLPIAPRHVLEFTTSTRDLLGIARLPDANMVCKHLRNVALRYGEMALSPDDFAGVSKVLTHIFQTLGELEKEAENDDQGSLMVKLLASCADLRDIACLPDQALKCLRLPRDVYQSDTKGMSPIKASVESKVDGIERGMKLLGRLERPGIADIADTMLRLRDRGTILSESELKAVLVCLKRLASLLIESPPEEPLVVALPNEEGAMLDPDDLIWVNDPVLGEQLNINSDTRVNDGVSSSLYDFVSIPCLSDAEASPHGDFAISNSPKLIKRCEEIGNLLRSSQFLDALNRIAKTEKRQLFKANLAWLEHVQVDGYREVNCEYKIKLSSGKKISIGTATTDVTYIPIGEGGRFFVSESALDSDLEFHFSKALRRQLDSEAPTSNDGIASIQPILTKSPESLPKLLDKLRFARLDGVLENDDDDNVDDNSHYFGDEDANSDEDDEHDDEVSEAVAAIPEVGSQDNAQDTPIDQDDDEEEYAEDVNPDNQDSGHPDDRKPNRNIGEPIHSGRKTDHESLLSRFPLKNKSGVAHGRMTQGDKKSGSNPNKPDAKTRQQDGFWISRPKTAKQDGEERASGFSQNDEDEDGNRLKIGDLAVGWVLQYEHSQGRNAISMAHANPGYDIESRRGTIVERFIEVKGIDGAWGLHGVALSSIQFFRALYPEYGQPSNCKPLSDRFWLYVVENARDPQKVRIHMIQNPAALATQFRFDYGWREAGSEAKNFVPLEPKKGMKLYKILDDGGYAEGVITRVDDNNYLMVKFGDESAKTVVYDPTRHLLVRS